MNNITLLNTAIIMQRNTRIKNGVFVVTMGNLNGSKLFWIGKYVLPIQNERENR